MLFSLPFLWMASTSVKSDRELFTEDLQLLPLTPHPEKQSPYVDRNYFSQVSGPHKDQLLSTLEQQAKATGYQLPADVEPASSWQQISIGLYERLSRTLPKHVWEGPAEEVLEAAKKQINADAVGEVFSAVHRRLLVGQIRVRSKSFTEYEVGAGKPFNERMDNQTPGQLRVESWTDAGAGCASLDYDFSSGDQAVLSSTFTLPFDAQDLQQVRLNIRPDDTWHDVRLVLECNGKRYEPHNSEPLANFEWKTLAWQHPGEADDDPTRIRTWVLLDEAGDSSVGSADPREMKLTLELHRCSQFRAWCNKLRLNYTRVLGQVPFWRYLATSLFLVVVNVVLTVFACSLVAYSFARLRWPGRDFCFLLMLATMMIPGQVTMIPNFLIWKWLGAYNTLTPLWLGSAFGNAFFIFLLRQFLKGIPRDLEDAARIDGCGFLRIYWHIMLPLVKPSLAAIAIFTFMGTWNDFMGPLIYVADQRLYPLAFGLYAFSVQVGNNPLLTMAGSLLMTMPIIVIFFFAQKYFIQGITLTGIKG